MSDFSINFSITPTLDTARLNAIINVLKQSMGPLGKDIHLVDEKELGRQLKAVEQQAKKSFSETAREAGSVDEALKKAGVSVRKTAESASGLQKAFAFNQVIQSVQYVTSAFQQVIDSGVAYESSLQAVGAITGLSGAALDKLGSSARALSVEFGSTADDQLRSFQGILSKLGPDAAKNSEALGIMARNVNILSKASGDDAATSMNAITDAMLQMGLASGTPLETAANSTSVINALAASAQVGAAEIPQVAEAILQAGVAAKGANMDIVSINAAIQVLAVGGKTGAEAGTSLRNVLGLLQNASGPAEESMRKLGTSSRQLGEVLTTQGLDSAMKILSDGMNRLGSDSERNSALMDIFGTENAAAAGILMQNLDKFKSFSDGIREGMEGTGSAFEQAGQRMDTAGNMIDRAKAYVNDAFISMSRGAGSVLTALLGVTAQVAPMAMTFASLGQIMPLSSVRDFALAMTGRLVPSLVVSDVATRGLVLNTQAMTVANVKNIASEALHSGVMLAKATAVRIATAAQWLWNNAIMANPIGLIIAGITAFIGVSRILSDVLHTTARERTEELKSEDSLLSKQIETTKVQQKKTESQQNLLKSYEELGQKSKRTSEEEEKFRQVQLGMSRVFPGLIDGSRSFAENLESVKNKARESKPELARWADEVKKLESKKIELQVDLKKAQVAASAEAIEDSLTDAAKGMSWDKVNKGIAVGFATGGLAGAMSGAMKGALGDTLGEALFGASEARTQAEESIKKYKDAIFRSANEADLDRAAQGFKMAILNDKNFEGIDPKVKENILKQIDDMAKSQAESIKSNQARATDLLKTALNDALDKGMGVAPDTIKNIAKQTGRPIEEIKNGLVAAFIEGSKAGEITDASVQKLSQSLGRTNEETRGMLLSRSLEEASKSGALTEEQVGAIADRFHLSREKALELFKEQQKQTAEALKTSDAVKTIGQQYDENKKKIQGQYDTNIKELNALKLKKEQGRQLSADEDKRYRQLSAWIDYDAKQLQSINQIEKETSDLYPTTVKSREKSHEARKSEYETARELFEQDRQSAEAAQRNARIEKDIAEKKSGLIKSERAADYDRLALARSATAEYSRQYQLFQNAFEAAKNQLDIENNRGKATDKTRKEYEEAAKTLDELNLRVKESRGSELDISLKISRDDDKMRQEIAKIQREMFTQELDFKIKTGLAKDSDKLRNEIGNIESDIKALGEKVRLPLSAGWDPGEQAKIMSDMQGLQSRLLEKKSELDEAYSLESIKSIQNQAAREREIKIFEAGRAYRQELIQSQGSQAMKYQAFLKFQESKLEAEEEYLRKSSGLADRFEFAAGSITRSIGKELTGSIDPVSQSVDRLQNKLEELRNPKSDDRNKALDDIQKEEEQLFASYKKREIAAREFFAQSYSLEKKRSEALAGESGKSNEFLLRLQAGAAKGFMAVRDNFNEQSQAGLRALSARTKANIDMFDKVRQAGFDAHLNLTDMFKGSEKELSEFAEASVGSSISSFGAMLAAGEEVGRAFRLGLLKNLVETAENAILTYIPQIYAAFLSWMGPWGIAAATGAIALVYSGLEAAKSAIGAWQGVVDIQGPGSETSDSIPARLSRRESVITARGTLAEGNAELFRWINRTGRPAFEYYIHDKPELREKILESTLKAEMDNIRLQKQCLESVMLTGSNGREDVIRRLERQNNELKNELAGLGRRLGEFIEAAESSSRRSESRQAFEFEHSFRDGGNVIYTKQEKMKRKRLSI